MGIMVPLQTVGSYAAAREKEGLQAQKFLTHPLKRVREWALLESHPTGVHGELLICHGQADDILPIGNATNSVPPIATAIPLENLDPCERAGVILLS